LFLSLKEGIGRIVDALSARLAENIHRGAEVVVISRISNGDAIDSTATGSWQIALRDGASFVAEAIVCAAPAFAIAPMIQSVDSELAKTLSATRYASAATVNLAYRIADFPNPPVAFGFVVPVAERRRIIAGSFSSLKFAGRAPVGMVLARVFIGGALQTGMMNLGDDEMIAAARDEFASLLGVTAQPMLTHVRRWPDSMPQYAVGHLSRVIEIERMAAGIPGLALAGAYLRGVGIPDCIASGERAAEAIFAQIVSRT
jgi:protoporphyrinogen/coproporphyrinogen III oxidase